jgi:hypothetical protein
LQAQYDGVHVWGALPHMDGNDTLIVRTCAGNYLKLGNQTCNYPGSEWPQCKDPNLPENWMKIDYQMIRPTQ